MKTSSSSNSDKIERGIIFFFLFFLAPDLLFLGGGTLLLLKEDEHRAGLADILRMELDMTNHKRDLNMQGGNKCNIGEMRLTPCLWASFLMTPFCGERITVSIFIDSMLPSPTIVSIRNRK